MRATLSEEETVLGSPKCLCLLCIHVLSPPSPSFPCPSVSLPGTWLALLSLNFPFLLLLFPLLLMGFPGGSVIKNLPPNAGDKSSIPGLGRVPGEGNGSPLQYSCLGNPMDRGAWQVTVHGVPKNRTPLSMHTLLLMDQGLSRHQIGSLELTLCTPSSVSSPPPSAAQL